MKQEELLKALVSELMGMDELHQEYQDNDTHFVIDSTKEGNTLTIKVQLLENKDKKEFEEWLKQIDDDFLSEILDKIREEEHITDLNDLYESEQYKKVINKVKSTAKKLASIKIKKLQKLL